MKLNPILRNTASIPLLICLFLSIAISSFGQTNGINRVTTASDNTFHALNTQACNGSLGDPIVYYTFGAGTNFGAPLASGITTLQYLASSCPNDGQYSITNYTSNCFTNAWHTVTDHTGDANGYFMLINASYDPSDFYVQQVNGLCSGTTYQFSAWIINVLNKSGIAPNISFSIEKTDGTILQSYNTGDIQTTSSPVWKQYGMFFTTPPGITSVVLRMRNNAPGGNGNDIGLDDIAFRPAGPLTNISFAGQSDSINVCDSPITLNSNIETCYLSNEYQWQVSTNNGNWTNISGATTTSYTVPVQPAGNYKYRLLVSQAGNININTCRVNSNVKTVVVVPQAAIQNKAVTICNGQTYTLPSGKIISTAGNYKDTVRYAFGCDSLITNLQLAIQLPIFADTDVAICENDSYKLPTGVIVSAAGIYRDTVKYKTGCDSLIRTIHLNVRAVTTQDTWINICEGETATLPWGKTVSTSGIFSDTTKYIAGCDSVIMNVHVHVTVPVSQSIEGFICPAQTYTLPSGNVVNTPGLYNDTLRTSNGCDSIITFLTLNPSPPPAVQLSKSNDVTCSLGISQLNAAGGAKYLWWPAATLNNSAIANPVASPVATTVYHVKVSTEFGCVAEDSIVVNVTADPSKYNIYIPNAFTPNGDGLNDCFEVKYLGQMSNLKFSIYDRWGNRVFYTTNPLQCWDGTCKGKQLKSDVFIYQISATTLCGEIFRKGTVLLIR